MENVPLLTDSFIQQILMEDRTEDDVTTNTIIPPEVSVQADVVVKQSGIIAGLPFFSSILTYKQPLVSVTLLETDGTTVSPSTIVAHITGPAKIILQRERVALNILQRCSGIATLTYQFIKQMGKTSTKLLDTRKTTPGLRILEKYAVRMGGGVNHRLTLADMILIKDNHIAVAGSVTEAINRVRTNHPSLFIEVETQTLEQVQEAFNMQPDRIMLDNMSPSKIQRALDIIGKSIETEISGGITLNTIQDFALLGATYISTGAVTHSAKALDISLDIHWLPSASPKA